MTGPSTPTTGDIKALLQRIFRMRHRFRVDVPENIEILKKRLAHASHSNPIDHISDFNLFYNLGGILAREPEPTSMGEVSRQLNVPLSTATRIVDWTVNNGYVQRMPDPEDRRVVRVALTETGQAMYREIDAFFQERIERLMRNFTPEERSSLLGLMEKIVNTMEQEF